MTTSTKGGVKKVISINNDEIREIKVTMKNNSDNLYIPSLKNEVRSFFGLLTQEQRDNKNELFQY